MRALQRQLNVLIIKIISGQIVIKETNFETPFFTVGDTVFIYGDT